MKNRDIKITPGHPELDVNHIARVIVRKGLKPVEAKRSISHKAVIYRVNRSNCRKRFEKWADQLVAIFATVGVSNRLERGCGNKVSRKGKFGLRLDRPGR